LKVNSKRLSTETPDPDLGTAAERAPFARAETCRVATFNVENYLDDTASRCCVKSAESKAEVRECIRALRPDVLALQEMGNVAALMELRAALKAEGLHFPHWEHVSGSDANVHVAILSRFPFSARRPHTDDTFELGGRRFRVRRGFAEVDVQVSPNYQFTLLAAHLKSRKVLPDEDAAGLRFEEAKLLREKIDARLAQNADAKIIVLGDFNDTEDSATLKIIRGTGGGKLFDTRPGDSGTGAVAIPEPGAASQGAAWTTFHAEQDRYERIDYVLISRALMADWVVAESHVLAIPDWRTASDHRPVVAAFRVRTTQASEGRSAVASSMESTTLSGQ
jgi:endonuclease/exonuclease/phosphatase family metal-dependent hydrolase